jgi:hypothetical protein
MNKRIVIAVCACVAAVGSVTIAAAGQHASMPAGMSHEDHLKQMQHDEALKKRGATAMGFDQDGTTHHFTLTETGGVIEVAVKAETDTETRDQIRQHLKRGASEFATGNFSSPMATHAETPPGVPVMQQRSAAIQYRYEETPRGGRVKIETTDSAAVEAIHAFLRYQIHEHKTGDPK